MRLLCDRDDVLGMRATSATAAGTRLLLRVVEIDGRGNTALPTVTFEMSAWALTEDGVVMEFVDHPAREGEAL